MLNVKTPEEVCSIIRAEFSAVMPAEGVPLSEAYGRILHGDIRAEEHVPGFSRSTVDGFAVCARDTFGCSDAIPAILNVAGEVIMGEEPSFGVTPGHCATIFTGGALPEGADAAVMLEYAEDYGDGSIGIQRPSAPGENVIFRGDDVFPGKLVLSFGRRILAADVGALAAMGVSRVSVCKRPLVGVISTGDELIPHAKSPGAGQVRDANAPMLNALMTEFGASTRDYGVIRDERDTLQSAVARAAEECDMVLLSGGSSVGEKDAAATVMGSLGTVLLHGVAMKPGKPTILAKIKDTPVLGLPGHPAAAFFVARLFARQLLAALTGETLHAFTVPAVLLESIGSNHGRAEYVGVHLLQHGASVSARPIRGKSGLITLLSGSDGYITVPRDCEGLPAGATVSVTLYS